MYFTPSFLATLLVSVNALATPHLGHDMHRRQQHAALAKVRAAAPEPVLQPGEASAAIPNARLRKRCKPRTTSSVASTSSAVSSSAASSPAILAPSSAPPPANVAPAPKPSPSTSKAAPPPPSPSPTPSPSPPPAPSPSPPPSQATTSPSSSSGGGSGPSKSLFTGEQTGADITFYEAGLGACGIVNSDHDFIAAVSQQLFDFVPGYNHINPNTNPVCGKKVLIEYQGKQVTVTITDRCVACKPTDLDLTPDAFSVLADQSIGRLRGATWTWLS